jgi:hypothetical protein
MRKLLYLVLPLGFFMLYGCQKNQESLPGDSVEKESLIFTITDAKDWFMQHVRNSAAKTNFTDDSKIKNFIPQWNIATSGEDQTYSIIEVPLKFDRVPGFIIKGEAENSPEQNNINGRTTLLIIKNKSSGKIQSVLMHVISSKPAEDNTLTYFNRGKDFSGNIFFSDISGRFINGWIYENGRIIASSRSTGDGKQNERAALPENCETRETEWYERTCVFYDDYSVECSNWEYVGSTYQTYCSEGGSGGGGGYTPPPCDMEETQAMVDGAIATGQSVSETISITTSGQTTTNGEITRTKNYTWKFYTGRFLTYSWSFFSYDQGVHFKSGTNWFWKSFTHMNIAKDGSSPFEVICNLTTATPFISTNKLYADMTLKYVVEAKMKCLGFVATRSDIGGATKGYHVSQ